MFATVREVCKLAKLINFRTEHCKGRRYLRDKRHRMFIDKYNRLAKKEQKHVR